MTDRPGLDQSGVVPSLDDRKDGGSGPRFALRELFDMQAVYVWNTLAGPTTARAGPSTPTGPTVARSSRAGRPAGARRRPLTASSFRPSRQP
jgi:hypothetical protein